MISLGAKALEGGHRTLLKLSGGRFPKSMKGMQVVELHVTGRKSGKTFSSMLTAPICDDSRIVVIASKGGHTDNPDWYKNLVANPNIEITIDDKRLPFTARTASKEEKAEMWPTIVAKNKGYAGYQENTTRDIPVVICEPRAV